MDDYSDFLDFPFYGEAFEERGSTLLVVEEYNRKSFFMCGEDNWDCFAGRNLVDISLEAGFVYERIIQLLSYRWILTNYRNTGRYTIYHYNTLS